MGHKKLDILKKKCVFNLSFQLAGIFQIIVLHLDLSNFGPIMGSERNKRPKQSVSFGMNPISCCAVGEKNRHNAQNLNLLLDGS